MKRSIAKILSATILAVLLGAAAIGAASAQEASRLPPDASIRLKLSLEAVLVTLPDAPSFTARGAGTIRYAIHDKTASIKSDSVPRLVFESAKPIAEFKKLTVIVDGIPGTTAALDWSRYPAVALKDVDLRVRAYEALAGEVSQATKPLVDIVLSNLSLSTDPVTVEGMEDKGFIDTDALEAQLVGQARLPSDDFAPYAEWLAGKDILLKLTASVVNPFLKSQD